MNRLHWGKRIVCRTSVVFSCLLWGYIILFAVLFSRNITDAAWLRGGPTASALLVMLGIGFIIAAVLGIVLRKRDYTLKGITGSLRICCLWFCGFTMISLFAHLIYKDLLYLSDGTTDHLFLRGPSFQFLMLLFAFSAGLTFINRIFRLRRRIPLVFCFMLHYLSILLLFSGLFFGIGGGLSKSYQFLIFLLFYTLLYALSACVACMLIYWGKKEDGKQKEYVSMFDADKKTNTKS